MGIITLRYTHQRNPQNLQKAARKAGRIQIVLLKYDVPVPMG
jgi:hypothetical protein